jgi:hypothetical protein
MFSKDKTMMKVKVMSDDKIKSKIKKYKPKIRFGKSLSNITLHSFLSFIDQNQERDDEYFRDNFDLDDVDWR